MTARPAARRCPPPRPVPVGGVFELDRARIQRALQQRRRYRYVVPRVERQNQGWVLVSPNCSRNVDASGGDILIAWFEPDGAGRWRLHARDHQARRWVCRAQGQTLPQALDQVCRDEHRVYWP